MTFFCISNGLACGSAVDFTCIIYYCIISITAHVQINRGKIGKTMKRAKQEQARARGYIAI